MSAQPLRAFRPESPPHDPIPDLSVREVVRMHLDNLRARLAADDFSAKALDNAERDLGKFVAMFGEQSISACRQHDLTRFMNEHPEWKAGNTKKRVIGTVVGCFTWAEEEEIIDRCPYRRPRALKRTASKVRRPAEPHEYVAIMRGATRVLQRPLYFMRRTGARTCETVDLLWMDCHEDDACPHIYREKSKTRRRTGKPRLIGLEPGVAAMLRRLRKKKSPRPTDHVFLNADGTPWDGHTFARHFRRVAQRLGLDDGASELFSPYCLRHRFTVDGLEGGSTAKEVADQLGHSDSRMVETVYGSHTRTRLKHIASVP
ncbi:MAG TPA: site-specific integrase, partial [Gemmataceae bacterium]|nr:site-specific integrase [Gemmataceae bacterium]